MSLPQLKQGISPLAIMSLVALHCYSGSLQGNLLASHVICYRTLPAQHTCEVHDTVLGVVMYGMLTITLPQLAICICAIAYMLRYHVRCEHISYFVSTCTF